MTITYRDGGPIKVSEIHFPEGVTLKLVQPPMSDTEWRTKGEPWIVQIEYENVVSGLQQTIENAKRNGYNVDNAFINDEAFSALAGADLKYATEQGLPSATKFHNNLRASRVSLKQKKSD